MPTGIDVPRWTRRRSLAAACAGIGAAMVAPVFAMEPPGPGRAAPSRRVAAAWDDAAGRHHVGLLHMDHARVHVSASIEVPTRAHGLALEPDGSILAVARRPGEWLLRWRPQQPGDRHAASWHWLEGDSRLNGHVLVDGDHLLTTETDQESGEGQLVRRDRTSLAATARWPTRGADPHAMLMLPDGQLLVANGGIASRPETGRAGLTLERMDSSLVFMSPSDGAVGRLLQVPDPRLSLRHLAWHRSGRVAVAMQAQHDDAQQRADAPVLALLDLARRRLHVVASSHGVAGYAGDVAAIDDHWFVSCPRAGAVMQFTLDGTLVGPLALQDACALAGAPDQSWGWASGRAQAWQLETVPRSAGLGVSADNHALAL